MPIFPKVGIPSPASAPIDETDRIPCQKISATKPAIGDFCSRAADGFTPATVAAPGLKMCISLSDTTCTLLNKDVRVRYGAPRGSAVPADTLLYLSAATPGAIATEVNGDAVARVLANDQGVNEGVIALL